MGLIISTIPSDDISTHDQENDDECRVHGIEKELSDCFESYNEDKNTPYSLVPSVIITQVKEIDNILDDLLNITVEHENEYDNK